MPDGLNVCVFVCTGTEANELAMRIARSVSGHNGEIVMEASYHGNSTLIAEMSMSTLGCATDERPEHVVWPDIVSDHRAVAAVVALVRN